ncbi:GNAT family N-acetyltransferase [Botrimarina mediterranea]|uniref:Acetyltransferase (GNAT) family protein n=1 Tax=Botrimarina mediterranea TaxID=2528022 RepID=A0A518KC17_9BACT|nr:GNAT family N-acetyltransferase [Botrimarina mediterranea]QDV75341.1 Acetyltransferase (GNAT) family protein [Botrimarina mediterranea]QDV80010.1 Acetyltransferase (GNAT) family protein [Planctomycetes bacterium K2D]
MVTLRKVTRENWVACAKLSVHDHQQGYVASNVSTIAESKFEPHHQLRAICNSERVVGMLAYCHEDDPEDVDLYWIFRLLIDKDHQRQGHAAQAMLLALEEIRQRGGTRIRTMHKPSNRAASALYSGLGFKTIGNLDDGDTLLEIILA